MNSPKGKSLLWVAVHELGHSIGLDHSGTYGAVMYPIYQSNGGKDFDLNLDDVKGAQSLYGKFSKKLSSLFGSICHYRVPWSSG